MSLGSARVRTAYHEAGHALVARDLGLGLKSVSLTSSGGFIRREPLERDATDEEIENRLTVVFAGPEAERYAPEAPAGWPQRNGDEPWLELWEIAIAPESEEDKAAPSDEAVIEHYTKQIGEEAVERARDFAVEYVERMFRVGRLEGLADELMMRGSLTGEDVERLLA